MDVQLVENLFVQKNKKFWRTTTDKLKKEDEEAKSDETRRIFVDNALRASAFQNSFHVFTLICYGLLSGLSLAYILFAFVLTFEEFYVLSGWWSMVLLRGSFYFGSILVAVCCLDRFVIGDTLLETVRNIVHFQIHCIGILLSMLTFLATVVICMYENWLTVDADLQRTELNASTTMTSKNHLISVIIDPFLAWQWLVLFRSVTVAVGWILFATTPNFNYLRQQIEDLIRNYINLYGTDTNA